MMYQELLTKVRESAERVDRLSTPQAISLVEELIENYREMWISPAADLNHSKAWLELEVRPLKFLRDRMQRGERWRRKREVETKQEPLLETTSVNEGSQ